MCPKQDKASFYDPDLHLFSEPEMNIGPLKKDNMVLAGLRPDSQRYFDHHHAANDTFEHVNKRELELGAATMTSLVYLYDKYGLNPIQYIPEPKK